MTIKLPEDVRVVMREGTPVFEYLGEDPYLQEMYESNARGAVALTKLLSDGRSFGQMIEDSRASIVELNLSSESDENPDNDESPTNESETLSGHSGASGGHMAKITNPATLQAQQELRQQVALTIATLKAVDMAVRRDYRPSVKRLADEAEEQASLLYQMALLFEDMPNKERA